MMGRNLNVHHGFYKLLAHFQIGFTALIHLLLTETHDWKERLKTLRDTKAGLG